MISKTAISGAKIRLQQLRAEILKRRHERPILERHADAMDNGIALHEANRIAADRDRDARRLREIVAALEAIRSGEYGVCARCEEEISEKRLGAVPEALICRECQSAIEINHNQGRTTEAAYAL